MFRRPRRSTLFPYPTLSRPLKDSVDIAIRVMSDPPPMLVARDMGPVRYSLCASSDWLRSHRLPETPSELSRTPLITSGGESGDRKSTRLNSSHGYISYAVFC